MKKVYSRPKSLKKNLFHYCPGCGHSIVHRLICEVIDEMNLQDRAIGIPPPGCSVFAYNYMDVDMAESAHGRGAAVATGIKRAFPDAIAFTYQGDGGGTCGKDIAIDSTGNCYHIGLTGGDIFSNNNGKHDIYLVKIIDNQMIKICLNYFVYSRR